MAAVSPKSFTFYRSFAGFVLDDSDEITDCWLGKLM